jgi:outer membrane protein OmpA-like peptidoglycan-associated protein
MKAKTNFNENTSQTWLSSNLSFKSIIVIAIVWLNTVASIQAQEIQYTKPSWKFGVAGGANFNYYQGSTNQLNTNFTPLATFHDAKGIGLFVAPVMEYHRANTRLGFMLQAGFDSRKATFDRVKTACDCPADLAANWSYFTIEPSLRFAPFQSNFYLFGGPRFAFIRDQSFTYQLGVNPAYPNQSISPEISGDFDQVNTTIISMQIGAGFDIPLTSQNHKTQFLLSPFASFHPYFGQNPRTIETLSITTLRAGVALKFGQGHRIQKTEDKVSDLDEFITDPEVQFSVFSPANLPNQRRVREVFPLRNYVFFNIGSTKIPNRYHLLKKRDVKNFAENQLEMVTPINQSGRSERQMNVYYNVINIIGDRMVKNPTTAIILVGSSEKGPNNGLKMAKSIQNYLVNTFEIELSRISIQGQFKPKLPSEKTGGKHELVLLREGDRRVSIESLSPIILAEFQSGSTSMNSTDVSTEAPLDSYVTFQAKGANKAFTSWFIQVIDETGKVRSLGPYQKESASVSGETILGNRPEGNFTIKMIGHAKSGKTVTTTTNAHIVLWTPSKIEEGLRYSMLFEFDNSEANTLYESYLTDVVTPKIPENGIVIIHGHADIIGNDAYNLELSKARANDIKNIIENALTKLGRTDVTFETNGYGENENYAPFKNEFPEERFYNRTVIIDIFKKQ